MWFISKLFLVVLIPYLYVKFEDDIHPTIFVSEYRRIISEKREELKLKRKPGPVYEDCNLCIRKYCNPSIESRDELKFHPDKDVQDLMNVMKGIGHDDKELMRVLTSHSETHREIVLTQFRQAKGESLSDLIFKKYTLDTNFAQLMYFLAMPLHEFYAKLFRNYIDNLQDPKARHLSEDDCRNIRVALIEILTVLPSCMIKKILFYYKYIYKEEFSVGLSSALRTEPKTDLTDVYIDLANTPRDDNGSSNWFAAWRDAKRMQKAVKTHSYEATRQQFRTVFTKRPILQVRDTIILYEKLRQGDSGFESIYSDISDESRFSSAREIYDTMTKVVMTRDAHFEEKLRTYLKSKSWDKELVAFIRAHCGIDLGDICEEYIKKSPNKESPLTTLKQREKGSTRFLPAMEKIVK